MLRVCVYQFHGHVPKIKTRPSIDSVTHTHARQTHARKHSETCPVRTAAAEAHKMPEVLLCRSRDFLVRACVRFLLTLEKNVRAHKVRTCVRALAYVRRKLVLTGGRVFR